MIDHGLDTIVAGVRCRDVLADLSEFLDGTLTASRVAELQAHLAACDRCARFGHDVGALVAALRDRGAMPTPSVRPEVSAAVMARIGPR